MTMTNSVLTTLLHQIPPVIPDGAEVMIGAPGEPMLTLVDDAELALRRDRRASRSA